MIMYILSPYVKPENISDEYYYEPDINGNKKIILIKEARIIPFLNTKINFGRIYFIVDNIMYDYEGEGIILISTREK
jgi:hypothetical protein